MNNTKSLHYLPSISYGGKIAGTIVLGICLFTIVLSHFLFQGKSDWAAFVHWGALFGLTLINLSKEKNETQNSFIIRYLSFKISFTFIVSFILSFELVKMIFGLTAEISAILILSMLNIIFFINYYFFKIKSKTSEISIEENTVVQNIKKYPNMYLYWTIISVISVLAIYLLGKIN